MTGKLLERLCAKRAKLAKKDLLELAGKENIELWHSRDSASAQGLGLRSLDTTAPRRESLSIAITASIEYAPSRCLALGCCIVYALSVGRARG
ncbi:MAG: hypothetical protein KME01_16500 [Chroococcus sp. CMT-3BRIN-NPC107]|nr:hypothetical protein [Chroococcus sp. CMT-3BRIN-NPC107]